MSDRLRTLEIWRSLFYLTQKKKRRGDAYGGLSCGTLRERLRTLEILQAIAFFISRKGREEGDAFSARRTRVRRATERLR